MRAKKVYENIEFERRQNPIDSLDLGLINFIRKECGRIGLTKEATVPIVSLAGGPAEGTIYQFTDETMANMAEYRNLDHNENDHNENTFSVFNSEEGYEIFKGDDEIYNFIKSGKMEKFFNLEDY